MEHTIKYKIKTGSQSDPNSMYGRLRALVVEDATHADLFVIGADDPEMTEIQNLLMLHRKRYELATCDGRRVHPGNAYQADPIGARKGMTVVFIECDVADKNTLAGTTAIYVDHHKFGDRGFSMPPGRFWEGSSIGQLYTLLKLGRPLHRHLVLAAMDHCMLAARLGKCPGVDSEEVAVLGRQLTAERNGVALSWLEECIRVMQRQISSSLYTKIGNQDVIDFMGMPIGMVYSLEYLCVQEALADLGLAGLVTTRNKVGDPEKIVLCGAATEETIESFINEWAPEHGLINIYGVPVRGYAGGYKK